MSGVQERRYWSTRVKRAQKRVDYKREVSTKKRDKREKIVQK